MTEPTEIQLPLLARGTLALILITLIGYLLATGSSILAPLAGSVLLALLLLPLCRWLERRRIPRMLAIIISILSLIIVLGGVVSFFTYQVIGLQEQLPLFQEKGLKLVNDLQNWAQEAFGLDRKRLMRYVEDSVGSIGSVGGAVIAQITNTTGNALATIGVMPIYLFFLLYYRSFFAQFILLLLPKKEHYKAGQVIKRIEAVAIAYLGGLGLVTFVVGVLNAVGLYALGIENALFFGALASVLTIIPYIGIFIGSIFPAAMALVTKDQSWYALAVIAVLMGIQFLESNFITPNIVGSRVSVNPFAAIVALFVGGGIWGIAGMIMAIPFTAILKVIFDNVESLQPYGFLIGEPPSRALPDNTKGRLSRFTDRVRRAMGFKDPDRGLEDVENSEDVAHPSVP